MKKKKYLNFYIFKYNCLYFIYNNNFGYVVYLFYIVYGNNKKWYIIFENLIY